MQFAVIYQEIIDERGFLPRIAGSGPHDDAPKQN